MEEKKEGKWWKRWIDKDDVDRLLRRGGPWTEETVDYCCFKFEQDKTYFYVKVVRMGAMDAKHYLEWCEIKEPKKEVEVLFSTEIPPVVADAVKEATDYLDVAGELIYHHAKLPMKIRVVGREHYKGGTALCEWVCDGAEPTPLPGPQAREDCTTYDLSMHHFLRYTGLV